MKTAGKIICLILISVLFLSGCQTAPVLFEVIDVYDNEALTDTGLVLENDYLLFQFDCGTTQFSLTDKTRGTTWYSNPPDALDDAMAVQAIKEKLQSQIVLTYGQISGTTTEVNNYTLSIAGGTYDWEATDNSIKVRYTIGRVEKVYIVPPAMPESRFKTFYDQMNGEQQNMMNNYFRIIDINRLRPTDNLSELLEKYPEMEEERIFELRAELQSHIMDRIETAFEEVGYTYEDFLQDSHTTEDSQSENPVFNISIIYSLDGADFVVTVPQDEIEYRHAYPILTLSVLPYFGAAGADEDGFMFVPDASGALIYNNNEKHNQSQYSVGLYGFDTAIKRPFLISENFAYLPVFGAAKGDDAFLCVIEEGDTNCTIDADVSGRTHTYNNVNVKYNVISWDDVDISKANVIAKAFDRTELTGEFRQRYIFVSQPDYVDMATAYREYLMKKHPSLTKTEETELPLVVSLVGAIERTENTMGVPVAKSYPLTTYSEAEGILKSYIDADITNLRMNYIGWFNGGAMHEAPDSIKLISSLGGKKAFSSLLSSADSYNVPVFFEADFMYISDEGIFDSFVINRDSVRHLSRENARIYRYCFACFSEWSGRYGRRHAHYLANTDYTLRTIDSFYEDLQKLGGNNITFASIGRSLFSDFNIRKPLSRAVAAERQTEKLIQLTDDGARYMVRGANIYAAIKADTILDMPGESNNFNIIDESVPFYQIVMHGLIPYTGSPVNLSPDYERSILKAVETGSGLQFVFMNEPGESLLETNYSRYFASDINRWGNEPIELYQKINYQLGHTVSMFITNHKLIDRNITLTQYEDGTRVVVNYSHEPYDFEGITVGAMDFEVVSS